MSLDSTGTLTNATDGKTDNEAKLKYVSEVEFLPENEANSWCYLFIHHTKIDIVNRRLIRNFPTFIHTSICYKRENKHIKKEERPTISGLLFVQGDALQVQSFLSENFFGLHLVKDCSTKRIATISDKVMQSFMRISQISPTRIRFMDHPFDYYSTGNPLVKITSGVLAGMEGFRIRIARDKCLVTTIGGMTVAISGIHKDSFENLDTYVKLRKEQLKDDRVGTIALTPLQSEIDRCFFPAVFEVNGFARHRTALHEQPREGTIPRHDVVDALPPQQTNEETDKRIAEIVAGALVLRHIRGREAVAIDHVRLSRQNGRNELAHLIGRISVVTVHHHVDIGIDLLEHPPHHVALALLTDSAQLCPGRKRQLCRTVRAVVVVHPNLRLGQFRTEIPHHLLDGQ